MAWLRKRGWNVSEHTPFFHTSMEGAGGASCGMKVGRLRSQGANSQRAGYGRKAARKANAMTNKVNRYGKFCHFAQLLQKQGVGGSASGQLACAASSVAMTPLVTRVRCAATWKKRMMAHMAGMKSVIAYLQPTKKIGSVTLTSRSGQSNSAQPATAGAALPAAVLHAANSTRHTWAAGRADLHQAAADTEQALGLFPSPAG